MNNGRDGLADESKLLNDATDEWTAWMQDMSNAGLEKTYSYSQTFDAYLGVATQSSSMVMETSTASTTVDALINGTLSAEDLGLDSGSDLSGLAFPDLDIGVGQLPGLTESGSGQIGGNAWYLVGAGKSDEQIAGAWDFLKFVNQTENQVLWTTQGSYLPVFSGAEQSDEIQSYFTDTQPGMWLATALESVKEIDPDFPGPVIGPFKEFRTAVRTALEDALVGGQPIKDTFETANTNFQAALDAYKADFG